MTDAEIIRAMNIAQITFGLMLIVGLLLYIAFFKNSGKHRSGKEKR